jgi:hypothetical protein
MQHSKIPSLGFAVLLGYLLASQPLFPYAYAESTHKMDPDKARVVDYWTKQRIKDAIPRDLVIDARGLGYLKKPDGTLLPFGHEVIAEPDSKAAVTFAKPPGAGGGAADSTPPLIFNMDPASGDVIGSSHTFSATVTDASGVKSVSFVIQHPDGVTTQSFNASKGLNSDSWNVTLHGFTAGDWSWWIVAKDDAGRGGNTATSQPIGFRVDTAGSGDSQGSGGGATDTISNAVWTAGGTIQTAAGRVYFEMPANAKRKGPWNGYVCSGTVIDDQTTGRSVILTAAHCVYDDVNKAFARNVLFIPNQAGTSGSGTDLDCTNDPLGCWTPSFGVVDINWTHATFPDNIPWDYAYYVVEDSGAHAGAPSTSDALDGAAGVLPISFLQPYVDDGVVGANSVDYTHAIGYSYSEDPKLMYCAEDMTTEGLDNWWLPSCGLSGGSSGGGWVQPMDVSTGNGPVISVNSWGYTNSTGMAGPKLFNSSASCLFVTSTSIDPLSVPTADGETGIAENCP